MFQNLNQNVCEKEIKLSLENKYYIYSVTVLHQYQFK